MADDDTADGAPRGFLDTMLSAFADSLGSLTAAFLFICAFNWLFPNAMPAMIRLVDAVAQFLTKTV